jgi:uncharacterized RmlC-like cupin family protein
MELTMAETINWRTDGVKVVRAYTLRKVIREPSSAGRATAFDFVGGGEGETWIGTVTLQPHAKTGPHHHGRHEVSVYLAKGRAQIRWGERLEFAVEVSPGDFVYFAPYVPHQKLNIANETLEFVVVRSDKERIAVGLDIVPVERPEQVN